MAAAVPETASGAVAVAARTSAVAAHPIPRDQVLQNELLGGRSFGSTVQRKFGVSARKPPFPQPPVHTASGSARGGCRRARACPAPADPGTRPSDPELRLLRALRHCRSIGRPCSSWGTCRWRVRCEVALRLRAAGPVHHPLNIQDVAEELVMCRAACTAKWVALHTAERRGRLTGPHRRGGHNADSLDPNDHVCCGIPRVTRRRDQRVERRAT